MTTAIERLQERLEHAAGSGLMDVKLYVQNVTADKISAEVVAAEILDILDADARGECTDYMDL